MAEKPFSFEMELDDLPKEQLKLLIYQEMMRFVSANFEFCGSSFISSLKLYWKHFLISVIVKNSFHLKNNLCLHILLQLALWPQKLIFARGAEIKRIK